MKVAFSHATFTSRFCPSSLINRGRKAGLRSAKTLLESLSPLNESNNKKNTEEIYSVIMHLFLTFSFYSFLECRILKLSFEETGLEIALTIQRIYKNNNEKKTQLCAEVLSNRLNIYAAFHEFILIRANR